MTLKVPETVEQTRVAFREWMSEHESELTGFRDPSGQHVTEVVANLRRLQRLLFDSGWIRIGWDERLGGLGGQAIMRSVVCEELANAGYPPPFSFATQEVLGPAVAKYARPELSSEVLPALLRGDESWCQGFSEPGSGSDLASLRLRAVQDTGGWRVSGEKLWTSWAQFADRCVLLARTGTPESGHKGISAFFLDMDSPGIEISPLTSIDGEDEFCSLHFDDVFIPDERVLGEVNGGWGVTMFILNSERGAVAWQRQVWLRSRLNDLARSKESTATDRALGESLELLFGLRLLSRRTVRANSDGIPLGVSASLDKLAMSTAEKFLFDTALEGLSAQLLFESDAPSSGWRSEYLYSRASSIYGGAAEIQRNIIAEHILGLPRG